jgi:ADP-heptose:LPS heptosyltransferase
MERPSWEKRLAIRLFDASSPLWAWAIRRKTGTPPAEPRRITVLAFWGIGDAVLLTPLLRALRRRYPGTWIELIGKPFLRHLFAHDSCVNEITVYAPPWVAPTRKYRLWSPKYVALLRWLAKRRGAENDWVVTTRGDIREHLVATVMGETPFRLR